MEVKSLTAFLMIIGWSSETNSFNNSIQDIKLFFTEIHMVQLGESMATWKWSEMQETISTLAVSQFMENKRFDLSNLYWNWIKDFYLKYDSIKQKKSFTFVSFWWSRVILERLGWNFSSIIKYSSQTCGMITRLSYASFVFEPFEYFQLFK